METVLEGVRVLDLTRALAGPYGSLILGDLGAEIIKIEALDARAEAVGIYSYKGQDAYFMSINRSKKSITLDTRTDKGREILYDLVRVSDVVFDNFRPGVLERLKIDYDILKEINPESSAALSQVLVPMVLIVIGRPMISWFRLWAAP